MLRVNVAPVAKVSMAVPVNAHNVNHEAIQLRTPLQAVDGREHRANFHR